MKSTRKIGWLALVAATYSMVAGGPFGLEEIVGKNGYAGALLILCLTPLLWALPTTLVVSELASVLPETGGYYVWARRAMGPFWGFQESWLSFVGSIFDMAIYPILFSAYLAHLVPALGRGHSPLLMGTAMIAVSVAMNLLGTTVVGEGTIVFVVAVLAPFGFLTWIGFASLPHAGAAAQLTKPDLLGGVLIAMWNYMGWDNASLIAGDVHDAKRTYSRAMAISLVIVVVTYILPIQAVAHEGIPASSWDTGSWVTIAAHFGGQRLAVFITAAAVVAAFSTFNTLVLSLSRLPYAMARDGFLPQLFVRENGRGAPWVAIIACGICWALATVLGFDATVMLDVLLTGLSIILEFAALIALRVREPHLHRPFRIWGGPAGAVLLTIPPAFLILLTCVRNHSERLGPINAFTLGMALILLGVIVYFLGPRRRAAA